MSPGTATNQGGGSPFHSPVHQQENKHVPQAHYTDNLFPIPETLVQNNLFSNPANNNNNFQVPLVAPVSPASCLPASLQQTNSLVQYPQQNTQQSMATQQQFPGQQQQQWNIQAMRPMNDLSSSTSAQAPSTLNSFQNIGSVTQPQEQQQQQQPESQSQNFFLNSSDISQLLCNSTNLPEMSDSFSKLLNLDGGEN